MERLPAKKPERLLFRIHKGCLMPNDPWTADRLKARGYHIGDTVLARLDKPRNPGAWRTAHYLGQLCRENLDEFKDATSAHDVLKRIQVEANIACDTIPAYLELFGQRVKIEHRLPRSLSYAEMEDGEFQEVFRAMANYIAEHYWPSMTPEAIEEMAAHMPEAA